MTREFDSFDAIQTANFGFVVTLADAETAENFAYKTGIEDTVKEVLEIIDSETKQTNVGMEERYKRGYTDACRFIRHRVLALKGEWE